MELVKVNVVFAKKFLVEEEDRYLISVLVKLLLSALIFNINGFQLDLREERRQLL